MKIPFKVRRFVNYWLDRDFTEQFGHYVLVTRNVPPAVIEEIKDELKENMINTAILHKAIPPTHIEIYTAENDLATEHVRVGRKSDFLLLGRSGWKALEGIALSLGFKTMVG